MFATKEDKEIEYFMREGDTVQVDGRVLSKSDAFIQQIKEGNNELFRSDSLFLTAGALNGNKVLAELRNHIRRIITVDGVYDEAAKGYTMKRLMDGSDLQKEAIKILLSAVDTGVEDLDISEPPEDVLEKPHALS